MGARRFKEEIPCRKVILILNREEKWQQKVDGEKIRAGEPQKVRGRETTLFATMRIAEKGAPNNISPTAIFI